jgi:homoserine kinase
MSLIGSAVRVTVPASSANLGSGFDSLALALALYDTVEVKVVAAGLTITVTGEGETEVPRDDNHVIVRAMHTTAKALDVDLPGLELVCTNNIPHSSGLGSSAAAIVAGVAAVYGLAGREIDQLALELAAEMEGHADNAAASLFGNLAVCWSETTGVTRADRVFRAVNLPVHAKVTPTVFVPFSLSREIAHDKGAQDANATKTHLTRGLLPQLVPHSDAAFALSRAALAVHAFTAAPELLLPATDDCLHQDYREEAWPDSLALVQRLRADGIPAAISGAGPTVLALMALGEFTAVGFRSMQLDVARHGVAIEQVKS